MSRACAQSSCSAVPSTAACRLLPFAAPHSVSWLWESDVCAAERQLTRSGRWSSSAAGTGLHIPRGREEEGQPCEGDQGLSWVRGKVRSLSLRREEALLKKHKVYLQDHLFLSSLPHSWFEILDACIGPSSLCISTHRLCLENLNYSSCVHVELCSCLREQLFANASCYQVCG